MKRTLSIFITIILLATSFLPVYATNLSLYNKNVQFAETMGTPFIDQANRTQVPFRQTMEQLGYTVSWDSVNNIAIAKKMGITVQVPIGQTYLKINGQQIEYNAEAIIKDNRTYIPIRAVLEAFGVQVGWDSGTQTVLVFSDAQGKIMTVHFIDVGQGDSIFIDYGEYEALIDAGSNGKGTKVVNYITPFVDGNLDLVIATHIHEDHIGGLDDVINAFQVSEIIDSGDSSDSAAFNNYISAVSSEPDCKYLADEDMTIDMGDGATLKIIESLDGDSNVNNDSVITLLDYKDVEILLPGDAESAAEAACLSKLCDVDVLKAGHHGSRTASSEAFLDRIKPEYVIISAGLDNPYGHPHIESLQRFADIGATVYGTFRSGNIILTTNGDTYSFNTEANLTINDTGAKSAPTYDVPTVINKTNGETQTEAPYIGNSNTMKFHRADCPYISSINPAHRVPLQLRTDALSQGYVPCKRCNP